MDSFWLDEDPIEIYREILITYSYMETGMKTKLLLQNLLRFSDFINAVDFQNLETKKVFCLYNHWEAI